MTLTASDLINITQDVTSTYGTYKLYVWGMQHLAEDTTLSSIFSKAEQTPGEELVPVFWEALDEDETTDVIIEDLIEHLGNVENYQGFYHIISDEELSEHTPIYLLEKWGEI